MDPGRDASQFIDARIKDGSSGFCGFTAQTQLDVVSRLNQGQLGVSRGFLGGSEYTDGFGSSLWVCDSRGSWTSLGVPGRFDPDDLFFA